MSKKIKEKIAVLEAVIKKMCDHKKALRYNDSLGREKIKECFKCGLKE